jgi:hypothetical protein
LFEWVGTPNAFNVVSRTLEVITEHTVDGAGLWYVDDLNGCLNRRTYESDMSRVDDEVRTLLAHRSGCATGVHAFVSFNINEPITLHQVQVMASLATDQCVDEGSCMSERCMSSNKC